jgi:predicted Zn-dependent peptidase
MAITKVQVQDAAVKYLDPARLQVVAVGDAKKIGDGLKQFGTVEVYDVDGKLKTP